MIFSPYSMETIDRGNLLWTPLQLIIAWFWNRLLL